ncbi:MAG: hypothetical protein E7018_01345 [Alphaproteobacteria bacterium]|nr:hypothetical protein [Alphaproteobacteria bacterium]
MKFLAFFGTAFFALIGKAMANPACAVCTVAVGASLEVARRYGVDDSVVGVWAGAMLALLGYWLILWFQKKNWNFWGRDFLLMTISVGSIGFMYVSQMPYNPQIIGIFYMDALLFSTILGALTFIYVSKFYQWMKFKNGGHAHFPFEKVVLPVGALILLSIYFNYYPLGSSAPTEAELLGAEGLYEFSGDK